MFVYIYIYLHTHTDIYINLWQLKQVRNYYWIGTITDFHVIGTYKREKNVQVWRWRCQGSHSSQREQCGPRQWYVKVICQNNLIEIYNWQESCEIRQTTEAAWGMIENSKLPFPCMMWHHPPKWLTVTDACNATDTKSRYYYPHFTDEETNS